MYPKQRKNFLRRPRFDVGGRHKEKRIAIDLTCDEQLSSCFDPSLIEQAVVNLLDNAIKYSNPDSTVHLNALLNGTDIEIAVKDEGIGIAKKHQPRLFERFYRVDKARLCGKPTMVEFGAAGCVPCDMMQPILDKLRKKFPDKLNVVFVHVGENQLLGARFGVRSIPVQVFYDQKGKEAFRHVGFFAEEKILKQLMELGVT